MTEVSWMLRTPSLFSRLLAPLALWLIVFSPCPVLGKGKAPAVTRWMDPLGRPRPLHRAARPAEPLQLREITPLPGGRWKEKGLGTGRVCIIVHENIVSDIQAGLTQYESDLAATGFTPITSVYASGSPEEIRAYLQGLYREPESLAGAVLIGEIPYIVYEMMQDWGWGVEYEDFPCDVFYADLDGIWSDTRDDGQVQPGNGKYDTREGNLDLEIWVGRMKTADLPSLGTETDLLNRYFDKDHRYRTGALYPEHRALVYDDDDWWDMGSGDQIALSLVYDLSDVSAVWNAEMTTASDYRSSHMPAGYELMAVRSHGYPGGHGFYRNGRANFEYVYCDDYRTLDPQAVFYSFFVCSGSDYTASDYLAGTAAFNPDDSGLLAWGSTKTGGIWGDQYLYSALSGGAVFGEAFRQWFNQSQAENPGIAPQWWYGMVLIGDAALRPVLLADFAASPAAGPAPLAVDFTDRSKGTVTGWVWDFGDGGTGQDPSHTYWEPGIYDVTLTVSGLGSTHTCVKTGCVTVQETGTSIYRFESTASLMSGIPERAYPVAGLPWLDPDPVLDPAAAPVLFYQVPLRALAVGVIKQGTTVRIESR
jgi:hypothetical protein